MGVQRHLSVCLSIKCMERAVACGLCPGLLLCACIMLPLRCTFSMKKRPGEERGTSDVFRGGGGGGRMIRRRYSLPDERRRRGTQASKQTHRVVIFGSDIIS